LNSPFIHEKSLFAQTENFWHVVGWTFNCYHQSPKRWSRWRLLLNFWLELAEKDLEWRTMDFNQTNVKEGSKFPADGVTAAIFQSAFERNDQRKIMRAIFADGNQTALNEFGELYQHETKEKKKKTTEDTISRPIINIDDDQWGDWDQHEEDIEMDDAPDDKESKVDIDHTMRMDRINLRARVLSLILNATILPGCPFKSAPAILDYLTEYIKPLELNDFMDLFSAIQAPPQIYTALLLNTIEVYLPGGLPKTNLLCVGDEYIRTNFFHEQARTANAVDNAKLSILVEYLIGSLMDQDRMVYDEQLYAKIRKGIDARVRKADLNRRGKHRSDQEKMAERQLKYSGDRIIAYMALLKGIITTTYRYQNIS
jgi:hypothetical protein